METTKKQLTVEERQANVDRLIKRWKEEGKRTKIESEAFRKTSQYLNAIEDLKNRNEERGTPIVKI